MYTCVNVYELVVVIILLWVRQLKLKGQSLTWYIMISFNYTTPTSQESSIWQASSINTNGN